MKRVPKSGKVMCEECKTVTYTTHKQQASTEEETFISYNRDSNLGLSKEKKGVVSQISNQLPTHF